MSSYEDGYAVLKIYIGQLLPSKNIFYFWLFKLPKFKGF